MAFGPACFCDTGPNVMAPVVAPGMRAGGSGGGGGVECASRKRAKYLNWKAKRQKGEKMPQILPRLPRSLSPVSAGGALPVGAGERVRV